jgi:hypothetical protein
MEMLYRDLSSLDELDVVEVKEVKEVTARYREVLVLALDSFDPFSLSDLDLAF